MRPNRKPQSPVLKIPLTSSERWLTHVEYFGLITYGKEEDTSMHFVDIALDHPFSLALAFDAPGRNNGGVSENHPPNMEVLTPCRALPRRSKCRSRRPKRIKS